MNPRRTARAGAAAACVALCLGVVAGCSSTAAEQRPVAVEPSPSTGGSPQQQAAAAEHALLAAFATIPGAHVADAPRFTGDQGYESWTIDTSAASAFSAAFARLPHWPGAGRADDIAHGQNTETVQTSGPGTLARQSVTMTVDQDGPESSTLQVNVDVAYRVPKPEAEQVPGTGVLTVTLQPVSAGAPTGAATSRSITSRSTIARIAADINALPAVPLGGGSYSCPAIRASTTLTLDFAPAAGAPASSSTIVQVPIRPTGPCRPGIQVTVDGAHEPALDDSAHADLFAQIEQLAGITH